MQCDFINVTDLLMNNMSSSVTMNYNNFLNMLFGSYLADAHLYAFERPVTSKLHSGKIRIDPALSEFYVNADRSVMCSDIKELLQYIFDKPNTYKELYELIQYDDSLSVPMRKSVLGRVAVQYSDDASLVNMIYEAVYIAVTRQYENSGDGYVALRYATDISLMNDVLFANSEYVPPCKHFCGRSKELDELHAVISDNSTVIITGVAGIGKSELVRAYAKDHRKEYQYFGYYFYGGSLKDIIANVIGNSLSSETDLDTRYRNNLELLSSLGENVLLIIDNFNTSPEDDECFYDVYDLKCKVIFTSHMRFEDYVTYELHEFRHIDDIKTLTGYFYKYKEEEWDYLLEIYAHFGMHTFCIELCAKAFAKGILSPKKLYQKRWSFKIKDFVEKLSAKKDRHPKKKTYFEHIRELFNLLGLPEQHKQVLRIMIFAPYFGFRKDFFAKIMKLDNMVIVEYLIDVGLLYENYWGRINIQSVVAEVVRSELETNNETCSDFIERVRKLCLDEAEIIKVGARTIYRMVISIFYNMDFNDADFQLRFFHDCLIFTEQFGETDINNELLAFEQRNHREDPELKTLYLCDAASYEMIKNHLDNAIKYQIQAFECAKNCDNTLLQANTMASYAYFLDLENRKEEALEMMKAGITLLCQLEGDGKFYYDK